MNQGLKRRCPWSDDHRQLLKHHISEKEQNLKSEERMDLVYSKTMQKLYNGAKNALNNNMDVMSYGDYAKHFRVTDSCTSCLNLYVEIKTPCNNCSKDACSACLVRCSGCENSFCGLCSIQDLCICLGCRDKVQ